jgi:orotate phosphoribosyltransferase
MTDRERLIEIVKAVSFQHSEEPVFRLTSGALSRIYFNMKKTTMSAEGMHLVGKLVFEKIADLGPEVRAVGGLTLGADPIAYGVASYSYHAGAPINAFVIRKEPKGHGLRLPVEGNVTPGDPVVIVDDVVTTGGSTIKAVTAAQDFGLVIRAVIVLLDRCEQNGRGNIEALGYPVYDILTVRDFLPPRE